MVRAPGALLLLLPGCCWAAWQLQWAAGYEAACSTEAERTPPPHHERCSSAAAAAAAALHRLPPVTLPLSAPSPACFVIQSYYYDGKPMMNDQEFENLKQELQWEGSKVVVLRCAHRPPPPPGARAARMPCFGMHGPGGCCACMPLACLIAPCCYCCAARTRSGCWRLAWRSRRCAAAHPLAAVLQLRTRTRRCYRCSCCRRRHRCPCPRHGRCPPCKHAPRGRAPRLRSLHHTSHSPSPGPPHHERC